MVIRSDDWVEYCSTNLKRSLIRDMGSCNDFEFSCRYPLFEYDTLYFVYLYINCSTSNGFYIHWKFQRERWLNI